MEYTTGGNIAKTCLMMVGLIRVSNFIHLNWKIATHFRRCQNSYETVIKFLVNHVRVLLVCHSAENNLPH